MGKYRVWAEVTSYCYLDVEAKDADEAYDIASETDGGDFITDDNPRHGYWELLSNPDLIEK